MTSLHTRVGSLVAGFLGSVVCAAVAAGAPVGWVAELDGQAEVQRGDAVTPLAGGEELELGDHVRTAADSRAKLLFQDDSVLTLAERSELVIDEQVVGAAPVSGFSLLFGKMRAVVTDKYGAAGAKFEVRTPTAIAGVRGTSFITAHDVEKDETLVVGIESVTVVQARSDAAGTHLVALHPGEATTIARGAYPTPPGMLPAASLRGLTAETSARGGGGGGVGSQSAADPRLPRRPGERDGSPENRVVDQPIEQLKHQGVPPPPPPIRR